MRSVFVDFAENFLRWKGGKFQLILTFSLFSVYFHPIIMFYRFCLLPWAVAISLGAKWGGA
jgi:hypothetical protein